MASKLTEYFVRKAILWVILEWKDSSVIQREGYTVQQNGVEIGYKCCTFSVNAVDNSPAMSNISDDKCWRPYRRRRQLQMLQSAAAAAAETATT